MQLSATWFTEGTIDFELQKYRLLAYLKEVHSYFNASKLYPQLSDVIFHHDNLIAFQKNKRFLEDQFPKTIDKIDLQRVEIIYQKMLADDVLMDELENIVSYALNKFKGTIDNGAELYDLVEQRMIIEPVGLLPVYTNEGYVLLRYGQYVETRAYSYTITLFEHQSSRYKGLRLQYLQSWPQSIIHTNEMIKKELVRRESALKNPAFYCMEVPLQLPLDETLLPVAKRVFVKYLTNS